MTAFDTGHAAFETAKDRRRYVWQCLMEGSSDAKAVADYLGLKVATVRSDLRQMGADRYKLIGYLYKRHGCTAGEIAAKLMMRESSIGELLGRLGLADADRGACKAEADAMVERVEKIFGLPSAAGRGSVGDPCGSGPSNVIPITARRKHS